MYDIEVTEVFQTWFNDLPRTVAFRITSRIDRVRDGNFGDAKRLDESLSELRFFFGSGYRIYYTIRGGAVVLLLAGGDKSSQAKDIKKARTLLTELE
jgi:putative addiction module killer protein